MDESKSKPIKEYVTNFKKGKLLPNRKFQLSEKPKISIIIPCIMKKKMLYLL